MAFWDKWFKKGGETDALKTAAMANDPDAVNKLIAAGATVNVNNTAGMTPLMVAVAAGRTDEVAKLVMASGAQVDPAWKMWAETQNNPDLVIDKLVNVGKGDFNAVASADAAPAPTELAEDLTVSKPITYKAKTP